jgi:ABC-type uncharacterized transport system ATPase component
MSLSVFEKTKARHAGKGTLVEVLSLEELKALKLGQRRKVHENALKREEKEQRRKENGLMGRMLHPLHCAFS